MLIIVVIYLVFGPKKIPELARMLGKGINEMRRATSEIKKEFSKEVSGVKKDLGVDIDLKDPLGIKKTVEDAIDPVDLESKESTKTKKPSPPEGTVETDGIAKSPKKEVKKKDNPGEPNPEQQA